MKGWWTSHLRNPFTDMFNPFHTLAPSSPSHVASFLSPRRLGSVHCATRCALSSTSSPISTILAALHWSLSLGRRSRSMPPEISILRSISFWRVFRTLDFPLGRFDNDLHVGIHLFDDDKARCKGHDAALGGQGETWIRCVRCDARLDDQRLTDGRTVDRCSTVQRRWTVSSYIATWDAGSKKWCVFQSRSNTSGWNASS